MLINESVSSTLLLFFAAAGRGFGVGGVGGWGVFLSLFCNFSLIVRFIRGFFHYLYATAIHRVGLSQVLYFLSLYLVVDGTWRGHS